jgi:hypothetical protein
MDSSWKATFVMIVLEDLQDVCHVTLLLASHATPASSLRTLLATLVSQDTLLVLRAMLVHVLHARADTLSKVEHVPCVTPNTLTALHARLLIA